VTIASLLQLGELSDKPNAQTLLQKRNVKLISWKATNTQGNWTTQLNGVKPDDSVLDGVIADSMTLAGTLVSRISGGLLVLQLLRMVITERLRKAVYSDWADGEVRWKCRIHQPHRICPSYQIFSLKYLKLLIIAYCRQQFCINKITQSNCRNVSLSTRVSRYVPPEETLLLLEIAHTPIHEEAVLEKDRDH
jgi:hypothetical protein